MTPDPVIQQAIATIGLPTILARWGCTVTEETEVTDAYRMREKTIDTRVGMYFIFGECPDGAVDVNDGRDDVFLRLPRDVAEAVCLAQQEFREKLYALLALKPKETPC